VQGGRVSQEIQLIRHRAGAPGLRLGLGPGLRPVGALRQLRTLLNDHSFWARGRDQPGLRRMLLGSSCVVSLWQGHQLVAFGRSTSDGIYRAVLWDVVVADDCQGQGLGRWIVETLLEAPVVAAAERVYVMTTNEMGFYERLGFRQKGTQALMVRDKSG
jgi:ribosomal protein S18 acetylase RimI-like enzyme